MFADAAYLLGFVIIEIVVKWLFVIRDWVKLEAFGV